jgi:hypothetical protein
MYRVTFPAPRHKLEVSGQLHAAAALAPRKKSRYPFDRRLDGPQIRSGQRDVETNLSLPGLELRPLGRPAYRQSLYRLRYSGSETNYNTR